MKPSLQDRLDQDRQTSIDLSPLIDVVFILLIFFIVTTVFIKDPGVEVTRPEAETAFTPNAGTIFVAITANNEIWVDQRNVGPEGVRAAIERLSAENPEGGVVIQADTAAFNEYVINVMDAAKAAGVTQITLAAAQP